jgi:hypothetical protein
MRIGASRPHLGRNPDRLHQFLTRSAVAECRVRVPFDSILALRHVRYRDCDQLPILGWQRAVREHLPAIQEVPWAFELDGPTVPTVRKGSSHEALITYMTTRLPGETALSAVKSELGLTDNTLRKLREVLGKADHPTTTALREIGVRYVVRDRGRAAKSYLVKD